MKTQEELKNKYETLNSNYKELDENDIEKVSGGNMFSYVEFPCSIHHNEIFVDFEGLSILVYTGPDREVEDKYVTLLVDMYFKEDVYSPEPRFVLNKRDARAAAKFVFFDYKSDGNVADSKYILINK